MSLDNDVALALARADVLRGLLHARGLLAEGIEQSSASLKAANSLRLPLSSSSSCCSTDAASSVSSLLLRVRSPLTVGSVPHAARGGLRLSPDYCQSADMLSSEATAAVRRRGVALIAAKAFARGELLWEEGPITALQQSRHRTGRVCALCFRFLGAHVCVSGVTTDADVGEAAADADATPFDPWLRQLAWHCRRFGVGVLDDSEQADGRLFASISSAELLSASESIDGFSADTARLVIDRLRYFIAVANAGDDAALFTGTGAMPCQNACGELYCSSACRDAAWQADHRVLCVGGVSDAGHPLVRFKYFAVENNDLLYAGARVAVSVICAAAAYHDLASRDKSSANALELSQRLLDAYIGDSYVSLPAEDVEDDDNEQILKKEMVDTSFALLRDALLGDEATGVQGVVVGSERDIAAKVFESVLWWDSLLGRLNMNNHAVWIASPLHAALVRGRAVHAGAALEEFPNCQDASEVDRTIHERILVDDVVSSGLRSGGFNDNQYGRFAAAVLVPVLELVGQAFAEDWSMEPQPTCSSDDSGSDAEADGSCDSDETDEEMSRVAAALPGVEGLGVLAVAATMNHSCSPNTIVRYERHMFIGAVRALRDIAVGEELTHSYIEQRATEPQRASELRPYRFRCECSACVLDRE